MNGPLGPQRVEVCLPDVVDRVDLARDGTSVRYPPLHADGARSPRR
ncbi:hypothetical protein [Streptomyces sp. NPDC017086]